MKNHDADDKPSKMKGNHHKALAAAKFMVKHEKASLGKKRKK